jgi:hypothetical protein
MRNGTQKLFTTIEDARVMYDDEERQQLGRSWEAPDMIVALRVVGTLKEYLRAPIRTAPSSQRNLGDYLAPNLCSSHRNAVYPFIVGESKSDSSAASFGLVDRQIALVIKKSINIQNELHRQLENRSSWLAGPLIWCVSHRGPSWRICAGYLKNRQQSHIVSISVQTIQPLTSEPNRRFQPYGKAWLIPSMERCSWS